MKQAIDPQAVAMAFPPIAAAVAKEQSGALGGLIINQAEKGAESEPAAVEDAFAQWQQSEGLTITQNGQPVVFQRMPGG